MLGLRAVLVDRDSGTKPSSRQSASRRTASRRCRRPRPAGPGRARMARRNSSTRRSRDGTPDERLTIAVARTRWTVERPAPGARGRARCDRHISDARGRLLESRLCHAAGRRRYGVSQVSTCPARSPHRTNERRARRVGRCLGHRPARRHRASVVHNPVSNLKLGSGVAPSPTACSGGWPSRSARTVTARTMAATSTRR